MAGERVLRSKRRSVREAIQNILLEEEFGDSDEENILRDAKRARTQVSTSRLETEVCDGADAVGDPSSSSSDSDDENYDPSAQASDNGSVVDLTQGQVQLEETDSESSEDPILLKQKRDASYRKRQARSYQRIYESHSELVNMWSKLKSENPVISADGSLAPPDGLELNLLPFQKEGVDWMRKQEQSKFKGGILADEMGMGKTIQMIGLMLSDHTPQTLNLVVCPAVALLQWKSEIETHTREGLMKVLVFHGNDRATKFDGYNVVLTTYALLESCFRKERYGFKRKGELVKEKSLLHSINWGRIILDEAHCIKDRTCSTAKAVFTLKGSLKWALSGTPLQNRVGELYSQIRFLQIVPFCQYFCKHCPCKSFSWQFSDRSHCDLCSHKPMVHFNYWNMEILKPIQRYGASDEGSTSFGKLSMLLKRILLRRTKVERADDLGLPPRIVSIRRDYFNAAEEGVYESLYSDTQRQFSMYVANDTVLNNYANIFELLSKMRQAANHPDLVLKSARSQLTKAENERGFCGVCNDEGEDLVRSKCRHLFCRVCVTEYLESAASGSSAHCPVCFKPLTVDLMQPAIQLGAASLQDAHQVKTSILNRIDMSKWRSSTKIEALLDELTSLQQNDATIKSIVFSQFVNFLDLVQWRLKRAGFNCVKLDGKMNVVQRDLVIKSFMNDPTITVFLVSLKAGGVALNLTAASQVFILDPWWNPAVEDQAYDRIHRLGQYRPIRITRLIIENSIESRIIELQEKKKALFQSTIGDDSAALARLTIDDLRFLFVS